MAVNGTKPTTVAQTVRAQLSVLPELPQLDTAVVKIFGGTGAVHQGNIVESWIHKDGTALHHVRYEDGEEGDLGDVEVRAAVAVAVEVKEQLPKRRHASRRPRAAAAKRQTCKD